MAKLRMLAVSDVHGKEDIVDQFIEWARRDNVSYDVIVAAGDIGNPQRPGSMCRILSKVSKSLQKPVYYVKGNWDVERECGAQQVFDLDATGPVYFGDIALVGHGRRVEPFKLERQTRVVVLVTHYPPFSILDRGKVIDSYHHSPHAGVVEINYLIDHYRPRVHIFGHSHSFGGLEVEHNGTVYVNVARLDRLLKTGEPIGNYAYIDVSGNGDVRVEWRFINGVWKKCSGCGRVVHIPEKWALCRKCAHKADLKFARVSGVPYRALLSFRDASTGALVERREVKIPFYTLKDNLTLEDFLDIIVTRVFKDVFSSGGSKILEVPKDRVIEFYGSRRNEALTPFSEYLFSCNDAAGSHRLCLIMKIFSVDKKAHVFWEITSGEADSMKISAEYVLFKEGALNLDSQLVKKLVSSGFKAISYTLEAV
ncbi:metallophosphoesterase family protein [Infirmifilum sp. NZ]|uniref:metallophosphoesterase family protein n=1 Tax=Infirmifilum sp. NZ TaxID=2926850 RepID=UPI00279C2002|nr:metallophosphoesterase family protein [Infirmifilum sp. NZ]UNQ72833.1 metallophosphoesterase [Infirmifilum sp. NZ]